MNKTQSRYNDLVKIFIEKKCTLVTTFDEFSKITDHYKKVNIIASCGHPINDVYVHTFINRSSGDRCKECVKKDTGHVLKAKPLNPFDTEYLSYNILKENLKDFTIEKTVEGCLVDVIIKPKNINEDKYLPIQLKATLEKCFNCYSFGALSVDKYENMIIIMICINEEKIWLLSNDDIDVKVKINIGMNSNKYGKFEIDKTKLNDKLLELYKTVPYLDTKKVFNQPINKYQIREQEYRTIRENNLDFINFTQPIIDGQVYDFLIGNKRVQEKVCGERKERSQYLCHLVKNNIRITKDKVKKKHINYELGDNDFYWINIPDKNTFYIFPEKVLYDMNKINMNNLATLTISYDDTNKWTHKYKFQYNTAKQENNKNEILKILTAEYIMKNRFEKPEIIKDEVKMVTNLKKLVPDLEVKEAKVEVIKEQKKCIDCNIEIYDSSTRCNDCNNKYRIQTNVIKNNRPSLNQLKDDFAALKSYVSVGKKYNVSDNAIRKWMKSYQTIIL